MQRFEIDETSKLKIVAAYEIFKIQSQTFDTFVIENSYKKICDGEEYNVYSFSDYFQIGIRVVDETVYQKVIDGELPKGTITTKYLSLLNRYVEEIKAVWQLNTINEKFENAQRIINSAINEYINRDIVYNNYIAAKKNISSTGRNLLVERLDKEKKSLALIGRELITFKTHNYHNSNISADLEITLKPYLADDIKWHVSRTRENFNKLLGLPNLFDQYVDNYYKSEDESTAFVSLFHIMLTYALHSSDETFALLSEDGVTGLNRKHTILRLYLEWNFYLEPIVRNIFDMSVVHAIASRINFATIDYQQFDISDLQRVMSAYNFLVNYHKKYVTIRVRSMETNLFLLNNELGASRDTAETLGRLMRIDEIRANLIAKNVINNARNA
jgi:hypothetical protein